jgi:tRNA(Ile)-lysidine synthase
MKRLGATKIAVGHHADDQAETILMRLFSGSGFKGLRGMAPENDRCVIRPLLNVTKKEILEFCKKENLAFILDETNSNENFLRNKLRHKILPVLRREINPSIDQTLLGIGQLFYMTDDYLKSQLADMEADVVSRLNRRISIDVKKFTTYPDILQYYLVNDILVSLSPDLHAVKFNHVDSVIQIVQKNVGGVKLNLGNGVTCVKNKNKIEFAK